MRTIVLTAAMMLWVSSAQAETWVYGGDDARRTVPRLKGVMDRSAPGESSVNLAAQVARDLETAGRAPNVAVLMDLGAVEALLDCLEPEAPSTVFSDLAIGGAIVGAKLLEHHGVAVVLAGPPGVARPQPAGYRRSLTSCADHARLRTVLAVWEALGRPPLANARLRSSMDLFLDDGLHLSPAGAAKAARAVQRTLDSMNTDERK